ncbi:uncharacterized protein LOC126672484 [Mercurialis annua]|uniref:uncharacterized protein LOC126672484 n=1 Tax=Mercurialis annua TaxID=3986 RepID=UPI002160C877|nr:uncharacterized protein LOC126672484 [Mercurialis annua]
MNLSVRIAESSKICPRCGIEEETQLHPLKDCEGVRCLWLLSQLNMRVALFPYRTVCDWLSQMFKLLKDDDIMIFILSLWTLWTECNNIVFMNKRLPPELLFRNVVSSLSNPPSADRVSKSLRPGPSPCWLPLPKNMVKVNTDAVISIDGDVIRWGVSVLCGITEAEVAEAKAVLFGLQLADAFPSEVLLVESDAANVISRLSNPDSAMDPIQIIINDFMAESALRKVQFQHIRRNCNKVAHSLAKWDIFINNDCNIDGELLFPVNELTIVPYMEKRISSRVASHDMILPNESYAGNIVSESYEI